MFTYTQYGEHNNMTLPKGAILEDFWVYDGQEVAIYDVSHLLPTKNNRPQPLRKPGSKIERIFVHKSGGEGRDGFEGLLNSVRYVITHRNFPGAAYTFWASTRPDRDSDGRLVAYRAVKDEFRTFHTGGLCNDTGVALSLQGNMSARDLKSEQKIVAEAVLDYVLKSGKYPDLDKSDPVSTHSRSKKYGGTGKPICPGKFGEAWLDKWLETYNK